MDGVPQYLCEACGTPCRSHIEAVHCAQYDESESDW